MYILYSYGLDCWSNSGLGCIDSPGHCRSTGAPVESCATLVPQHGRNVNSTDPLPYELVVDTFEDPGLPQTDGSVLHIYSYNPGTTYNCML